MVLDHPRIRGEHRSVSPGKAFSAGSSPHTRGAHFPEWDATGVLRIIPAYAGSTRLHVPRRNLSPDHPRIRGEHWVKLRMASLTPGSSPHTRGAHIVVVPAAVELGIIPAYAGSTTKLPSKPDSSPGSSPHTRGARRLGGELSVDFRIIPAYAGSTSATLYEVSVVADHPRIRGEHTRALNPGGVFSGIIPAYAGSTLGNPCNTKDRRRDYTSFPLPVTHPSGGGGS